MLSIYKIIIVLIKHFFYENIEVKFKCREMKALHIRFMMNKFLRIFVVISCKNDDEHKF